MEVEPTSRQSYAVSSTSYAGPIFCIENYGTGTSSSSSSSSSSNTNEYRGDANCYVVYNDQPIDCDMNVEVAPPQQQQQQQQQNDTLFPTLPEAPHWTTSCVAERLPLSPVLRTIPTPLQIDLVAYEKNWSYINETYIKPASNNATQFSIPQPSECNLTLRRDDGSGEYRLEWYHEKHDRSHLYLDIIERDLDAYDRVKPSFEVTRLSNGAMASKKFTTGAFIFYLHHQMSLT